MTVAEMAERMSLREYTCWVAFLKMEAREQQKALKAARAKGRPPRRRR